MGELIRDVGDDRPICPMDMGRASSSPVHNTWNLAIDRLYDASKPFRDEDGELTDPKMQTLYAAVVYNPAYSRMQLHQESTGFLWGGKQYIVESWFYRCHLCGFILPANEVKKS